MNIDEASSARISNHRMPEERLFMAIIAKALEDAHKPKSPDREEARKFLLFDGWWAESRNLICDTIGLSGNDLRKKAMRYLST